METAGQWCDNASCPDCDKIGADNIKMHRYAERRLRCTTCQCTFSADKGTDTVGEPYIWFLLV